MTRRTGLAALAISALLALLVALIYVVQGPRMTITPLPDPNAAVSGASPLRIDTGSLLIIAGPGLWAEVAPDGRGRIAEPASGVPLPERGAETGMAPRPSSDSAIPGMRTFALDAATTTRLFVDLERVRIAWAARVSGEAAAGAGDSETATGSARTGTEGARRPPALVVEEVRPDRSTRLILQLDADAPEVGDIDEILTPLRLAR